MTKTQKTLKMKNQARHGDLLLQRVEKLPNDCMDIAKDKMVLAEGTATGHKHVMAGKGVVFHKTDKGDIFIEVKKNALLTHEEHATIEFGPGIYQVIHQVEFDAQQTARQVVD